jgi:hypothetical protein
MADSLYAVPYQAVPRPPMSDELAARCARAMHVITPDGRILRAGRASLFVLEKIGWPRLAAVLAQRPLIWIIELGYWVVARNRSLFSRVLFR